MVSMNLGCLLSSNDYNTMVKKSLGTIRYVCTHLMKAKWIEVGGPNNEIDTQNQICLLRSRVDQEKKLLEQ